MGSLHTSDQTVEILDIRISKVSLDNSLKDEILAGLKKPTGQKTLPTLLLYSDRGLKIFEDITYIDEYYLTNTEIAILEKYAENMASRISSGGIIVELGSGNLRKVNILLNALDRLGKQITYYALDLSRSELTRTLLAVPPGTFKHIRCIGLHGTYDDARTWLRSLPDQNRCILWLGSSAGNFSLSDAAAFLTDWSSDALRGGKNDSMLIGLDGCKDGERVKLAYNDPRGLTREFILNGLWHANELLGKEHFKPGDWGYVGEWNAEEGRHQAYYEALQNITFSGDFSGVTIAKGERINVEYSYKFDAAEARLLWSQSGLAEAAQWANPTGDYYLHMLYKPSFTFPLSPPSTPAPTPTEWKHLWTAWDTITLSMIPRSALLSKPIDLRNPCIFYIGHIPAFLDLQLSRATNAALTGPGQSYQEIFQRGIDPDVDDPSQCHSHSAAPESWPLLEEILKYGERVRSRTLALYEGVLGQGVQRALWTAFEHEGMHLETLLYMLLQSADTRPPLGVPVPDFESARGSVEVVEEEWVLVKGGMVVIGMDEGGGYFGWDNEKPVRRVEVAPFKVRAWPITNMEYARYLHATGAAGIPASWETRAPADDKDPLERFVGSHSVKTVFGPVALPLAGDWPVMASYNELAECAAWLGGRIPSSDEVRAVYDFVATAEVAEKTLTGRISAVNGHLINDGVQESPPLFVDLQGCNVGFRNWHPTAVRGKGLQRCVGGAWEWTSTVLERHEGFEEGELYPEYTRDFFDGKHNIVLGGSWATHPRIAGRKSFVNWYQRNYKFTWATARIVKSE